MNTAGACLVPTVKQGSSLGKAMNSFYSLGLGLFRFYITYVKEIFLNCFINRVNGLFQGVGVVKQRGMDI